MFSHSLDPLRPLVSGRYWGADSTPERLIWINAQCVRGLNTGSWQVPVLEGADINMSIPNSEVSLYERIGGAEAVAGMVDRFYAKVIADPNLRPYFNHVALDKLQHMQVEFFSAALDGPIRYAGRPVIHAHHGRGITRQHFQSFVEHLFETLANYPLSEQDRYEIISRINTYADDVIGSGAGPAE